MHRFQSIRGRLFLIFLLSLLGLLAILSFVYYQRATDQIRDKVSVVAEKNISQTVGLFDLLLAGYDSVTKSLNSNNDLIRLLQQHAAAGPIEAPIVEKRITDALGAIFYSRNDILGIHIVTNRNKVFSFDRPGGASVKDFSQTPWFGELKQSTGEMKWLGVYPESLMSVGLARPVFAFGRQLYELSELKSIGIVLIETDANAIASALTNASLGPGSLVIIRDANGSDIIRTRVAEDGWGGDVPAEWPGALAQDQVLMRETADAMLTAARIGMADWTMIGVTPNRELQLELKETQQFLLTVSLVLIAAAIVLASLVSRSFSSPFKSLIHQMKQVELGNFKGRVHTQSYDELNVLVASFNRMVEQMDELIERIKLASISEKNAQLQALQAQVNPHFLFNTLDMIYWMLDERENDRLGRVILALSRIFRYSSDWEEASRTTLRQELEQFRHYFTIIETRLGSRVYTSIEVEERWLDTKMPKMILQPIVENAVKYGLEPNHRPGALRVYSREAADKLLIVIEDNGIGMNGETLERVRRTLEEGQDKEEAALVQVSSDGQDVNHRGEGPLERERKGTGLLNVHRRIRLMFGEGFGLHIESERGKGTVVTASFPIPTREESSP